MRWKCFKALAIPLSRNVFFALATIAVKAVLTKTVKGEELGGGVTKVNASVITKDNVDEAEFWGNFDLEDGYWSETANIWNTYAIE